MDRRLHIDSVGVAKNLGGALLILVVDVESRTGSLFCQMCNDFVWDPTLEDLRLQKLSTGSFSSMQAPYTSSRCGAIAIANVNSTETETR